MSGYLKVPKAVINDLSSDLSALHETVLKAQSKQLALNPSTSFSDILTKIKVTKNSAEIYAGASKDTKGLLKASQGDVFPVIDKANDWYAVKLDKQVTGLDAGWIKASDSIPLVKTEASNQPQTRNEDIYEILLAGVNKIKEKYKNNAYISVTGFSINVGVPPSISVSFAFKK